MFIRTEETPNPESLKFIPGKSVLGEGISPLSFESSRDHGISQAPLARRILEIDGITSVMLGDDFLTVTKKADYEWYRLKPFIIGVIVETYVNGWPIFIEPDTASSFPQENLDEDPLIRQIRELLDTRIRPAVAQDGGDITFEGFRDGIVYVKMKGACSGCPSSTATLKGGIENLLKHYVPEVLEVRQMEEACDV